MVRNVMILIHGMMPREKDNVPTHKRINETFDNFLRDLKKANRRKATAED